MWRYFSLHYGSALVYDVLVIGGGHAGCEAAAAAARMGARTLLLTHRVDTIGEMSCNPSFGGIGKGHLIRELDALDGVCARICDQSGISFRVLNTKKGPAVWGLRAQVDRKLYKSNMQEEILRNTPNLSVQEGAVENLSISETPDQLAVTGVILDNGCRITARTVVLTTGTFLKGTIFLGTEKYPAGRLGEKASYGLSDTLNRLGFRMGRLRTGTPPRIEKDSIDFSQLVRQDPDTKPMPFSFMNDKVRIAPGEQVACFLTHTNEEVGRLVKENNHLNSHIREEASGPRYCPSLESKIMKFGKVSHQVWLEPEGLDSDLIYPQGISMTLPPAVQTQVVRSMVGLGRAETRRFGYGVQYDYVDPRQLSRSLETKPVHRLFLAGQINGTTGYEEAAAQGLIAGLNAAAKVQKKDPFLVDRSDSYMGVLVDDLTTLGITEPYRMFTSRAEFRLYLRPDNADTRLTAKGHEWGVVGTYRWRRFQDTACRSRRLSETFSAISKTQSEWRRLLPERFSERISDVTSRRRSALELLAVYDVDVQTIATACGSGLLDEFSAAKDDSGWNQVEEKVKLAEFYREPAAELAEQMETVRAEAKMLIPKQIDYCKLRASDECREKLALTRPETLGAAARIPGLTPVALVELMRLIKQHAPSALPA